MLISDLIAHSKVELPVLKGLATQSSVLGLP